MTVDQTPGFVPTRTFTRFAQTFATLAYRPVTVVVATLLGLAWICVGLLYHSNETWLLAIMATTVVTFFLVFLIGSQLRDTAAIQFKLSENPF